MNVSVSTNLLFQLNDSLLTHFSTLINTTQESIHASVKGGMKYNTGRLLMVLHKPLIPTEYDEPGMVESNAMLPMP